MRGPVQPFGVRMTIIGQRGRADDPAISGVTLDLANPRVAGVQCRREARVDDERIIAFDEVHLVAVAFEEAANVGVVRAARARLDH